MYLHIGNNFNVRTQKIIGIFDMDTSTVSPDTREYLQKNEKSGKTVMAAEELPKSFVVTEDNSVYLSQISTSALQGRMEAP